MAGSEGREGDWSPHGARDIAATEEDHRTRVGAAPSCDTRHRNRNRPTSRSAESDRREETVYRSEEGSSEILIFAESQIGPCDFLESPKRSSSFPTSPSQIRRWYDTRPHARRCPDGSDERLRGSDSPGVPGDGMDPEVAVLPSGRQARG